MESKIQKILTNTEKGLTFGLKSMNIHLGGIQREAMYVIGADSKVGKTTFVDYTFLLSPYLNDHLKKKIDIHWIYFSFEISRIRKMFRLAPYFFAIDYNKTTYEHKGETKEINSNYLMNKVIDKDEELITIKEDDKAIFLEIYEKRLVPLFGKIVNNNLEPGIVDIVERAENPTGLRNYIYKYASENGKFIKQKYNTFDNNGNKVVKERIVDYRPNNPKAYVIIITDHIRKLKSERGFNNKQVIDKWLEYEVDMRNLFGYTFVDIAHLNRKLDAIDRMKYSKEFLHPTLGDFKDSGNMGEEADYIITGFNPRDKKYMLREHFGHDLVDYPNYRSWHLIASRDTPPEDFFTEMNGNLNTFKDINN